MKTLRKVIASFKHAIDGVVFTLKTQRNMRFHFIAAILVLFLAMHYRFTRAKFMILFATITSVIVAEMINTSIEAVVDLVTEEYHPLAKIAKDVAAGAVFITAINALVVGYLLFFDKLDV